MLLDLLQTARGERYKMQNEARLAKLQTKGLEVKLKKSDVEHEIELSQQTEQIKMRFKNKYESKAMSMETTF